MKKYVYFISGIIWKHGRMDGAFHGESRVDRKIRKAEDIDAIAERVKEEYRMNQPPTIMNFKLLRIEEDGGSDA